MTPDSRNKPVFGPLVTPDLFATRWTAKFSTAVPRHSDGSLQASIRKHSGSFTSRLGDTVQTTANWYYTAHYCFLEAKTLGLANIKPDFDRPEPDIFEILQTARYGIDNVVRYWEDVKEGRKLMKGQLRWQQIPLALRTEMNVVIEGVRRAKAEGEWGYEAVRQAMEDTVRQQGLEWMGR